MKTFNHVGGELVQLVRRKVKRWNDLLPDSLPDERSDYGVIDGLLYSAKTMKIGDGYHTGVRAVEDPHLTGPVGGQIICVLDVKTGLLQRQGCTKR